MGQSSGGRGLGCWGGTGPWRAPSGPRSPTPAPGVALTKLQPVPCSRLQSYFQGKCPEVLEGSGEAVWAWGPHSQLLCPHGPGVSWGEAGSGPVVAVLVSCRTDQLGTFTLKEWEQLAPMLDGFSLMTYDYPTAQQ